MNKPTCSIPGCDGTTVGRGWCRQHYAKWHNHGDPLWTLPVLPLECSVDGCDQPPQCRGFCRRHYSRFKKYGDPVAPKPPRRTIPREQRFWAKVDKAGPISEYAPHLGRCWLWQGAKLKGGYGQFDGFLAHRLSYEMLGKPIPVGLTVDHLCRVRACVNPTHLEIVTHQVNILRGFAPSAVSVRTGCCTKGHLWTPETERRTLNGKRVCLACRKERQRVEQARRDQAKSPRLCEECGTMFTPKRDGRFCSQRCKNRRTNRTRAPRTWSKDAYGKTVYRVK